MAKAAGSSKEALVETRDPDEFATILKQSFKPRSDRAATEVENAVTTLVREALSDTTVIKDDVLDTIEGRERVARPLLLDVQLRDRLEFENSRHERL